jgi:hypothetical protein
MCGQVDGSDYVDDASRLGQREKSFLGGLPTDLVDVQLWPRLIRGSSCPTVLKRMGKIRVVCKAWLEYVENIEDWKMEMAVVEERRKLEVQGIHDVIHVEGKTADAVLCLITGMDQ